MDTSDIQSFKYRPKATVDDLVYVHATRRADGDFNCVAHFMNSCVRRWKANPAFAFATTMFDAQYDIFNVINRKPIKVPILNPAIAAYTVKLDDVTGKVVGVDVGIQTISARVNTDDLVTLDPRKFVTPHELFSFPPTHPRNRKTDELIQAVRKAQTHRDELRKQCKETNELLHRLVEQRENAERELSNAEQALLVQVKK